MFSILILLYFGRQLSNEAKWPQLPSREQFREILSRIVIMDLTSGVENVETHPVIDQRRQGSFFTLLLVHYKTSLGP